MLHSLRSFHGVAKRKSTDRYRLTKKRAERTARRGQLSWASLLSAEAPVTLAIFLLANSPEARTSAHSNLCLIMMYRAKDFLPRELSVLNFYKEWPQPVSETILWHIVYSYRSSSTFADTCDSRCCAVSLRFSELSREPNGGRARLVLWKTHKSLASEFPTTLKHSFQNFMRCMSIRWTGSRAPKRSTKIRRGDETRKIRSRSTLDPE